jgi:hypothetical protein
MALSPLYKGILVFFISPAISPMPNPLSTKAFPAIMGEMRDFFEKSQKL